MLMSLPLLCLVHEPKSMLYISSQETKTEAKSETDVKNGGSTSRKRLCWHCKSDKHLRHQCPERKKQSTDGVTLGVMLNSVQKKKSLWFFDSGATHHITNNFSDLIDPVRVFDMNFTVANSASMKAEYSGRVKFGSVTLETVYFCPTSPLKLITLIVSLRWS